MSNPLLSATNASAIAFSIILPAYNDAAALAQFLPEVMDFCQHTVSKNGEQCEVIIVNDGSSDNLLEVYQQQRQHLPDNTQLKLIALSRNFGKEPAVSAGLAYSQGDYTAIMDSDGQHPISVLEQMYAMLQTNPSLDMVAAIQAERPNENRLARTLKGGFYHFIQDSRRYEIRPNAGDFRIMKRKVVNALMALPERQRFMKGLYAWVGFNTVYLPFTAPQREVGNSKFNYASLFELALVGITSFSQKPLRLISRLGMVVSILAFLYGLYIVFDTLVFGNQVAGWATITAGIMFSTGLQLICLGVMGEYIGRLYEEVKQRPLYIVDAVYDSKSEQP